MAEKKLKSQALARKHAREQHEKECYALDEKALRQCGALGHSVFIVEDDEQASTNGRMCTGESSPNHWESNMRGFARSLEEGKNPRIWKLNQISGKFVLVAPYPSDMMA